MKWEGRYVSPPQDGAGASLWSTATGHASTTVCAQGEKMARSDAEMDRRWAGSATATPVASSNDHTPAAVGHNRWTEIMAGV